MGQMAANMGNPNITNPQQAQWGDLDPSEKGARIAAGGIGGLAKGFQGYQQQNAQMRQGGGGVQIPMGGQQPVDPSYFQPQKRANNPFYGGYGGQ